MNVIPPTSPGGALQKPEAGLAESTLRRGLSGRSISEVQMESVRQALWTLAADEARRYAGCDNSSLPSDVMADLIRSALYAVDTALEALDDGARLQALLAPGGPQALREHGLGLLTERLYKARALFDRLLSCRLPPETVACRDTLEKGIPEFFSRYDVRFGAHQIPGSIDYPLCLPPPPDKGLRWMEHYLQRLWWENRLCGLFPASALSSLWQEHGGRYGYPWEDCMDNALELALPHALAGLLLRKDIGRLLPDTGEEIAALQSRLRGVRGQALMEGGVRTLADAFADLGEDWPDYLANCADDAAARILKAAAQNRLAEFLLCWKKDNEKNAALFFEDSRRMENEDFRALSEELLSCRLTGDKLALVLRRVHSLEDLADLLSAGCFWTEEYPALFTDLEDVTLALLYHRLPAEAGGYPSAAALEEASLHLSTAEEVWQRALLDYLHGAGTHRTPAVRALWRRLSR